MKLFGSLLIIFASIASSFFYEQSLKNRIKVTEELYDLISYIKTKIEYFSLPINDILKGYQSNSKFMHDLIANKEQCDLYLIENEITNDIKCFFARIGKGFKKDQLALCEYTLKILDKSRDKMKIEFTKKAKIFRSLSLFVGFGVVILLV